MIAKDLLLYKVQIPSRSWKTSPVAAFILLLVPVDVPALILIRYRMWRYDFFLQYDRIPGDGEIEWRPTGLTTPTSRPANP
jgi:membrane protein YdbS with pleckstrin-like domain